MPAVLCIDHRVLDGADAVNFLKIFKQIMEDPDELLMSLGLISSRRKENRLPAADVIG